jgi:ArsR family transcriptional regulator
MTTSLAFGRDPLQVRADVLKALAHPLRVQVVELLRDGEMTVSELLAELGVGQPYLSQQLGKLRHAGLVVGRRRGAFVGYSLTDVRVLDLLAIAGAARAGVKPRRVTDRAAALGS